MPTAAVKSSTMESAAVESTVASAAMASTKAHVSHEPVGRELRSKC
jgi:hypothetical protein